MFFLDLPDDVRGPVSDPADGALLDLHGRYLQRVLQPGGQPVQLGMARGAHVQDQQMEVSALSISKSYNSFLLIFRLQCSQSHMFPNFRALEMFLHKG